MSKFYDGTKLLSMKDINNKTPEIYISSGNRSAGKTTYFNNLVVKRFFKTGEKFMLMYRYNYELDSVADKFFKDIKEIFLPNYTMKSVKRAKGIYHDLFIGEDGNDESFKHCGYAVSMNSADQIKKNSHLFSDTGCMLFDEFQSETGHYCSMEITKFISIHTSVARGAGKQVRRVPVYMVGNLISLLNPYYVSLGISNRLRSETKFLKGDGFVLEVCHNENASKAQMESSFNRAFSSEKYTQTLASKVYLNDNEAFIEKPKGKPSYYCTLRYMDNNYGVKVYDELGIVYCDDKPDETCKLKITVTTEDHQINYVMLKRNDPFIMNLRYYFEHGCFRFKNLACKEAVLTSLSY